MTARAMLVALMLAACQPSAAPGAYCTRASECAAPLVCALGRCRAACAQSRDCPPLARCLVEPSSGVGVCSLAQVDDCASHDCPLHFVCQNGACVNACGDIPRCPDGRCDANACTPATSADAGPPTDASTDAPTLTTLTLAIGTDADDGEIGAPGSAVLFDGESTEIDYTGFWAGAPTWAYVRYAITAAIPAQARIVDAHLTMAGVRTGGLLTADDMLAIRGDASADAAPVTVAGDNPGIEGTRTGTVAIVSWPNASGWSVGANVSPDLSPILQELIDTQRGLASGAHVLFWLYAGNYTQNAEVGFQDTTATTPGATLTITYAM